jgi:DNA-binding CsgD family transcriptional regulator
VLHRDFARHGYQLSIKRLDQPPEVTSLSPRENEILHWVAQGKANEEIAIILALSVNTVKTHLKRCFEKLGVENRTAAVAAWNRIRHAHHHPIG